MATAATPDMPDDMAIAPVEPSVTSGAERLVSLDFIRGIAVLGILFANITAFAHPFMVYVWPGAMPGGPTEGDKLAWLIQYVVIDHKMRGLFTILFGAGMMLFVEKAWARGSGRWLQFRRLLWLLLFGMVHYYLIWFGDILQSYAVWGIVALAFMKWRAKSQFLLGLALYGLGTLAMAGMFGSQYYLATHPAAAEQRLSEKQQESLAKAVPDIIEEVDEDIERVRSSSYPETVRHQVLEETDENLVGIAFGLTETIALILLGMALYRFGFFSGSLDPAKMRLWGWVGLGSGTVSSLALGLWAYAAGFPFFLTFFVFEGLFMLPRLAFVLGLAALLVEWAPRATRGWLGQRFVAAGRMAFSNYLGTSLIMLAVFPAWGLDLYGTMHRFALFVMVLGVWALMLLWSKPWLERYRYGPLEWLWRCLTYWRLFPLKR
ncbi:DUF418 domain-containing protein [Erythrobacter mangrovi]|uniref:DUF418 domain-containing protein n=1 Tax=Erythrobacter mangrovi TaxID=2739433 RepID=A0A7D4BPI6_9SPHN|nr:DUF418 domain-containing protein [Erythrobacter mangrovi]QKG72024.1 DUF418 domain-containing protein [Erythrobacter mangrovi]